MHSTKVTNFSEGNKFATVEVTMDSSHITTTMSKTGGEVTLFFDTTVEIQQFATDLLIQAAKASGV